jgi:hypothetical protein
MFQLAAVHHEPEMLAASLYMGRCTMCFCSINRPNAAERGAQKKPPRRLTTAQIPLSAVADKWQKASGNLCRRYKAV